MSFYYISEDIRTTPWERILSAPVLGLDIETAGQDGLDPFRSRIRLLQVSTESDIFILDLDKVAFPDPLRTALEDPGILKIFHNAKFDIKHLFHHFHVLVSPIFCTFLASQLISAGNPHHRHSLEAVIKRYLDRKIDKSLQTSDWSGDLTEEQVQYAAGDVQHLIPLYKALQDNILHLKLKKVSQLEFKTIFPVAMMELNGIRLDLEKWGQLEKDALLEQENLEQELEKELTDDRLLPGFNAINLHSPDQVRHALKKRGHHLNTTSEKELKSIAAKDPIIEKLLRYRHVSRILQTTLKSFRDHVKQETSRVHPNYFQIASPSGRFSCSDPNIQQVPREKAIREAFVPAPGNVFIIADYSQVELRVAAGLSSDSIMLKAYEEGKDLHRLTASLTTGQAYDAISKEERQAAKAINFGLIYAMGPKGLQLSAKQSYGVDMTPRQAETFHKEFFRNYAGMARWHAELEKQGRASHYIRTAAGRIRRYNDDNIRITELFNVPVQGTAAEILKSALCIFADSLKENQINAKLVAIIHDEIIVETPKQVLEETRNLLVQAMKKGASWLIPNVPFEVDVSTGSSWSDKS